MKLVNAGLLLKKHDNAAHVALVVNRFDAHMARVVERLRQIYTVDSRNRNVGKNGRIIANAIGVLRGKRTDYRALRAPMNP